MGSADGSGHRGPRCPRSPGFLVFEHRSLSPVGRTATGQSQDMLDQAAATLHTEFGAKPMRVAGRRCRPGKHRDPGPAGTGPEHSGEQVRQLGIEGLRGDQGCRSAPVVELGRRDRTYPAQAATAGDAHAVLRLRGLHHERIRSPAGLRRGAPRPQAGGRTGLHPGRAAFMRGASSRNWDRQRRPCTALPISSSRTGT